jgi:hypothetical protein
MLEKFLKGHDNEILDLRGHVLDAASIVLLEQELAATFSVIEIQGNINSNLIKRLIDRNKKKDLIARIANNDPRLLDAKLAYCTAAKSISAETSYRLDDSDIAKLINALENNTHLQVLQLNGQELLGDWLISLATAIKNKPLLALYLDIENNEQIDEFLKTLLTQQNNSLVRLVLNKSVMEKEAYKELSKLIENNSTTITQAIANAATLDEFLAIIGGQSYIPTSLEYFTGEQYKKILFDIYSDFNKHALAKITTLYGIRSKFRELNNKRDNQKSADSTVQVMQMLEVDSSERKDIESEQCLVKPVSKQSNQSPADADIIGNSHVAPPEDSNPKKRKVTFA